MFIFVQNIHICKIPASRARCTFALCWSSARALHYGAAAGASAGGRAKPAAARALNRFFARGALARRLEMLLVLDPAEASDLAKEIENFYWSIHSSHGLPPWNRS